MTKSLFDDDNDLSSLSDPGIGGLKADDALSRSEDRARRALAADQNDSPAPSPIATITPGIIETPADHLDGGSGRVVQRGPHLAGVFTIVKGNIKYLTGQLDRPDYGMWNYIVGILISAVFAGVFLIFGPRMTDSSGDAPPVAMILIVSLIADVVLIYLLLRARRNALDFHHNGQLLIGQVTSARGRWVTTGSGKNRSRNYKVTVNYRVRLSDGAVRDSSDTQNRNDLARRGVPEPGMPIAVLVMRDTGKLRLL